MKKILLDIESTGLNAYKGDKIIEIGCLEMINKVQIKNAFHVYINPETLINKEAYHIHCISNNFLSQQVKFINIANLLMQFVLNSNIIAHNVSFDLSFINSEFSRLSMPLISFYDTIDTLKMAKHRLGYMTASLNFLCNRFKIDVNKRTKHSALVDVELLLRVYNILTKKRQKEFIVRTNKAAQEKYIKNSNNLILRIENKEIYWEKMYLKKIPCLNKYNGYIDIKC